MYHIWKVWVSSLESKNFQSQNSTPKQPGFELECKDSNWREFFRVIQKCGWHSPRYLTRWFQIFYILTPIWGRFLFWLKFVRWVETTNQLSIQYTIVFGNPSSPPQKKAKQAYHWYERRWRETGIWAIRVIRSPRFIAFIICRSH